MVETQTANDAHVDRSRVADQNNDPSGKMSREAMKDFGSVVTQLKDAHSPHVRKGTIEPDGSLVFGDSGEGDGKAGRDGKEGSLGSVVGGMIGGSVSKDGGGEATKSSSGSGRNSDTVGVPDSPYDSSGVDQSSYGDCVFEATLAANAKTGALKNMITTNKDGSYTVKFPGDSQNPVNVTPADLDKYGTKDSADWAKVIETAMIKQYPAFSQGGGMPDDAPGGTDGKKPTPAQYAMYLLTGNTAPKVDATDDGAASRIQKSLDAGQPVVAFCKDDDHGALVSGHEWTVEKYDSATGQITVRNPWGSNPNSDPSESGVTNLGNGEVQMSMETFQKHYGEVTFGSAPNQQPDNQPKIGWY